MRTNSKRHPRERGQGQDKTKARVLFGAEPTSNLVSLRTHTARLHQVARLMKDSAPRWTSSS